MITLPQFVQSQSGVPQSLQQVKKKYIIDTDAGGDDAHAILTAVYCARLTNSEIIGITCLSGNTQLPQVIKNVQIALAMAGAKQIPIYPGCDRSLTQQQIRDSFFLDDGLSMKQKYYLKKLNIQNEGIQNKHAVDFIIESVKKYGEDLTLLLIGPLTNIACAIIKDHTIEEKIGNIIFLGGNMCGLGYLENGLTEFNAFNDVEAIHLIYKILHKKIFMIPYETVFTAPENQVNSTFKFKGTYKGQFIEHIYESMFSTLNRYDVQDPLTAIIAMFPEVITNYVIKKCSIILHGEARGLVAVDWLNCKTQNLQHGGFVTIIVGLDKEKVMSILHEVVSQDDPEVEKFFTQDNEAN